MYVDDRTIELSAEEGARVVALGLLAEAGAEAEALAAGVGEEPLHAFRVSLRRLRTALRTFRPWLEGSVERRHERKLKAAARSTNEARDAEVQLAWLASNRARLASARYLAGYDLLVSRLEARTHRGPDAVEVVERFRAAASKLEKRLGTHERKVDPAGAAGASFGGILASLVAEQVDALSRSMEAIRDPSDEETVHRARIEGKRLRYLLEPLRGYPRADSTEAVGLLKRLQDVLGDLHDSHVLAAELRDALVDAAAEQALQLHAAAYAQASSEAAVRDRSRGNPRAGLLAAVRLVRERRDALHATIERGRRAGEMDALVAAVRTIAGALEAREGGKVERERKTSRPRSRLGPARPGEHPAVRRAAPRDARRPRRRPARSPGGWRGGPRPPSVSRR